MADQSKLTPVELVIFGVAGDLTWRKLVPPLYNLYLDRLMPEKFAIFGVDAKPLSVDDLHKRLLEGVNRFSRRADQVENAWAVIPPVLDVWSAVAPSDFPNYPSGTWGPPSAEALIAQDGRRWLQPKIIDQPKSGG